MISLPAIISTDLGNVTVTQQPANGGKPSFVAAGEFSHRGAVYTARFTFRYSQGEPYEFFDGRTKEGGATCMSLVDSDIRRSGTGRAASLFGAAGTAIHYEVQQAMLEVEWDIVLASPMNAPTVLTLRMQYINGDSDITADPYAELDATEARAWDDTFRQAVMQRDADDPDRWRITGSDATVPDGAEAETFGSPAEALDYLAHHGKFAYELTT